MRRSIGGEGERKEDENGRIGGRDNWGGEKR